MSHAASRSSRRRTDLAAVPRTDPGEPRALTARPAAPVIEADVDGARVRICARDEVVIACGPASITLRRNGRVVIRGTHVETRAAGTNRIRGGQVRVN
jgi:hypothetical protein